MPMPYLRHTYLFPPRPENNVEYGSPQFREIQQTPGWVGEIKFEGQRNMIYLSPESHLSWFNRHGSGHKNFMAPEWLEKEVLATFNIEPGKWTVIDGEVLHAKDANLRNTLAFWDVIVLNGIYLTGVSREERKRKLIEMTRGYEGAESKDFIRRITPHLWIAEDIQQDQWDEWPRLTKTSWIEGFVLKRQSTLLMPGVSSKSGSDGLIRVRKPSLRAGKRG